MASWRPDFCTFRGVNFPWTGLENSLDAQPPLIFSSGQMAQNFLTFPGKFLKSPPQAVEEVEEKLFL